MPRIFEWSGYRFHFYSNEGAPREPPHVHVRKGNADAKFWLRPEVAIAYNRGFSARTLKELSAKVSERRDEIQKAWNDFFE